MAIKYLKKAIKTPSSDDKTRAAFKAFLMISTKKEKRVLKNYKKV